MTTPAHGRGRRKNKESTRSSLGEFNSYDAPHKHNVVSNNTIGTGLYWTGAMADQQVTQTHRNVPTTPRAQQRGSGVDFDSLPETGPFRVSLSNLPMSVEDKEIRERIFQGLDILRIESTKSRTTVELGSKNDLYGALCKDGTSIKGRTVNVHLFGQQPQNSYGSDRYGGGRGGNSSFNDRHADRDRGSGGQRGGARHGGFSRDRDSSYNSSFNRGTGAEYGEQPRAGGGGGGGSPNASSYYAGAKCLLPPMPTSLPMPPENWRALR